MNAEEQLRIIKRNTIEIITEEELLAKLKKSLQEKKPLQCKLGFDPSAPDLHLGHAVVLHKIKDFQNLGHDVVIVLGDFTGRIGDPTGRSEARPQLTEEEVMANAHTYQEQLFKILAPEKTRVVFNSKWLGILTFAEVIELAARYNVARMLEREDFAKRYQGGHAIGIHEFFYPLMQGYDSVALGADVEFGATEQKFNLLMGRHLQKEYGQEPQIAVMSPILTGLDGKQKMSKSLGNYIGINEPANEIYGKAMSLPDELMFEYFQLATVLEPGEIAALKTGLEKGSLHPRDAKMRLARELVKLYWGWEQAKAAEKNFKHVFQQNLVPENVPKVILSRDLQNESIQVWRLLVLTGMASSNSEARRFINQGGVRVNGEKVTSLGAEAKVVSGLLLQIGKRRFLEISF